MYFKRFFKIMAFAMAFPWVLYSCDNNGPDIYDGPAYQYTGFDSHSAVGTTDSGMELDDGTTVKHADSLVLFYPDGSKRTFSDVYYYTAGGVLYLSKPLSASVYTAGSGGSVDLSTLTAQQLVDGGYFKVPYNLCRDFAPMGRRYVGLASANGYLLDVWYFSQIAFYSDEFVYLFNLSDVYIAFIRDGSWCPPWENNIDNRRYRFFSTK